MQVIRQRCSEQAKTGIDGSRTIERDQLSLSCNRVVDTFDRHVLVVATVVNAPAVVRTVANGRL